MNKNISTEVEFLNLIYKNAEMGIVGINSIITKVNDESLEKILIKEKEEYNDICNDTKNILKKYGKKDEEISKISKISTTIMSEINLLKDSSSKNIVKMMIEGTNKGIIEITEKLNSYDNADEEIVELAQKLKNIEETNIEKLKKYL